MSTVKLETINNHEGRNANLTSIGLSPKRMKLNFDDDSEQNNGISDRKNTHQPLSPQSLTPKKIIEQDIQPSPSITARLSDAYVSARSQGLLSPQQEILASHTVTSLFGRRVIAKALSFTKDPKVDIAALNLLNHTNDTPALLSADSGKKVQKVVLKHEFVSTGITIKSWFTHYITTGSISRFLPGPKKYTDIAKNLKKLTSHLTDKEIAATILDILHDRPIKMPDSLSEEDKSKYKKLLTQTCYLLFSIETTRDEGALILNSMFMDLVKAGIYKISDIASLPLSAKKIVPVAKKLGQLFMDESSSSNAAKTKAKMPEITSEKVSGFLERTQEILQDWLKLKYPDQDFTVGNSLEDIGNILTTSISEWFGFNIKPFRYDNSDPQYFDDIVPLGE